MISSNAPKQFFYNGRYVDIDSFRTFVYNDSGQKLANGYNEYHELIASGLWFSSKDAIPSKNSQDDIKQKIAAASKKKLRGDDAFTISTGT